MRQRQTGDGLDVGALLRQARDQADLTQRVAARRAGITQSSLSRWETGAVLPSLHALDRVLAVCGVQLEGRLVRRHAQVLDEFARLASRSVRGRFSDHHPLAGFVVHCLQTVHRDVVLTGGLAAAAHGIPVERLQGEVLLPDDDEALARFLLGVRPCMPAIVLDGRPGGVELTVGLLRRRPVCDWTARTVWFTTRVLGRGDVRPASTLLGDDEGELVVQTAESLQPDGALREHVLEQWLAWRRSHGGVHGGGAAEDAAQEGETT